MEKLWFKNEKGKDKEENIIKNVNLDSSNDDTSIKDIFTELKEDARVSKIIGKESKIDRLKDLGKEVVVVQDFQKKYLDNLDVPIRTFEALINQKKYFLEKLQSLKNEFKELNIKTSDLHASNYDNNLPVTEEEKEINKLKSKIDSMENMLDKYKDIEEDFDKLKKRQVSLKKIFEPENPQNN